MESNPSNGELPILESAVDNSSGLPVRNELQSHPEDIADFYDQAPVGRFAAELLAKPQAILYLAPSPDSEIAFKLLETARIRFAACVAHDRDVPAAQWGDLTFVGIAGVKDMVKMLYEVDEAFATKARKSMPHYFDSADPRLIRWMEQLRELQLDEARSVLKGFMEELRSGGTTRPMRSNP